jgi:hypothetical protein
MIHSLQALLAARALPSARNNDSLHTDLSMLDRAVDLEDFNFQGITLLIAAVMSQRPDEEIWDRVYSSVINCMAPAPSANSGQKALSAQTFLSKTSGEEKAVSSEGLYSSISSDYMAPKIRLLSIQRSQEGSAELRCTLRTTELKEAPLYQALSYVWGDSSDVASVLVNAQNVPVTRNLFDALQHLRRTDEDLIIWIDALCINQNDNAEKSSQIQLMGDIYRQAKRVIVWLGMELDDSDAAMEQIGVWGQRVINYGITDFLTFRQQHASLCQEQNALKFIAAILGPSPSEAWGAATKLLTRPYWSRVWVFQELVLAKEAILACGQKQLPWRLISAFTVLTYVYTSFWVQAGDPGDSILHVKSHLLFPFLLFRDYGIETDVSGVLSPLLGKSAVELMEVTSHMKSTDDRDKVFAILGLLPREKQLILPDYTLSARDTYVKFAGRITQTTHGSTSTLQVLSMAGLGRRRIDSPLDLPTWVPDWRGGKDSNIYMMLGSNVLYEASLGLSPLPRISADGSVLTAPGLLFDAVREVVTPDGTNSIDFERWDSIFFPDGAPDYPNGTSNLEALFRTITCDLDNNCFRHSPDTETFEMIAAFIQNVCASRVTKMSDLTWTACQQDLARLRDAPEYLHLGSFFWGSTVGKGFSWPEALDFNEAVRSGSIPLSNSVRRFMGDRMLFITQKGYFGLGPRATVVGDAVCVLFGARVPLILREVEDHYLLVGESFIHGLVDGEAVSEFTEDKIPLHTFEIH